MRGLQLDKDNLEYICDDNGGSHRWFFDAEGEQYVCLNVKANTYSYAIPFDELLTEEEFVNRKMNKFLKNGFREYIPEDVLRRACALNSPAVIKVVQHKAETLAKASTMEAL